jgi:uncharacterized protein (TIGR00304 family)
MSLLIYAGVSIIFLGFVLILMGSIGSVSGNDGAPKTKVRGGGIIMLGPIPIIVGSDPGSLKMLILLALVLMAAYFLLPFLLSLL